jgi:hypothetical protein
MADHFLIVATYAIYLMNFQVFFLKMFALLLAKFS